MTPQVWSKFETGHEADAAWAAFTEYLHLADRPEIYEWAKQQKVPSLILKWSLEWLWPQRVAAYDEYTASAKLRKYYPTTHPLLGKILRMANAELTKWEAAQKDSTVGFIPFRDVLSMIKEVRAAERDLAKMTKETEEAKAAGATVQDFSKLSIEELRQLDTLMAKVSG